MAGFYILTTLNDQAPPVTSYAGCNDFVERRVSLCTVSNARLHLTVTNTFRLVLLAPGLMEPLTVIKGAYDVAGRTLTYASAPDGDFAGRVLLEADCASSAPGNGITFERGSVTFRFCRDPASLSAARVADGGERSGTRSEDDR